MIYQSPVTVASPERLQNNEPDEQGANSGKKGFLAATAEFQFCYLHTQSHNHTAPQRDQPEAEGAEELRT